MDEVEDDDLEHDEYFAELERRMQFTAKRLPLEEKARRALENGEHGTAISLWREARELALQEGEETTTWYVDGQLAAYFTDREHRNRRIVNTKTGRWGTPPRGDGDWLDLLL